MYMYAICALLAIVMVHVASTVSIVYIVQSYNALLAKVFASKLLVYVILPFVQIHFVLTNSLEVIHFYER